LAGEDGLAVYGIYCETIKLTREMKKLFDLQKLFAESEMKAPEYFVI
jgi:hypothetical protein